MVTGIIGRKVGMTQVFGKDGVVIPATVIKAGPCVVVQAKTAQTDGYEAVQLGLVDETPSKENKPTTGHYKRAGMPATRVRREVKRAPGGERITTDNLKVVSVDTEDHLLVLCGAVPGAPNGIVVVRRALKRKPDPQPQAEKKKGKK